jgi:ABC-type multidrug transport system permease subunit
MFYVVLLLVCLSAASMGYFISASFEDDVFAQSMAPLIVFPFILFGGLVSNNKSQLAWLSWIQYISPIKYGAEALLWNEFTIDPNGIKNDMMSFLSYNLGYSYCCAILILLILGFRTIAFFCLKLRVKKF